ncbi:uncharacterized protein E0L32_006001 [Thyridium curvatum]|uniref:Small-subunit processome Utp12 domain-containing protein n=1 Tax=Thyridium curvatum TaxID=1093900 RepID=A0A507BAA7_9PEZI|nr:uncharacterized protein E0L32_006001 [Thyridium curvatum]TPX13530.1 hypothetical protein E0L32_006001 [Thyridium curvatum]
MSTKRKAAAKLAQPVVKQSAKGPSRSRIDESKTSVSASAAKPTETAQTIEISSDSESVYDEAGDSMDEDEEDQPSKQKLAAQSNSNADTEMKSAQSSKQQDQEDDGSDAEATSPTFGDLVRNNEMVEVPSSLAAQHSATALTALQSRTIAPPATSSLGTVLNQALRTDDTDLLESCLHTTDLNTVRNTIQRMDSSLAGTLLTKLAARMHRRPGRAHSLMSWVQWTLVAHGGALATQPDLVRRLGELNRVLEERARGLNSLLALKGKLDMLEAQMQLRRTRRARGSAAKEEEDSSDDEAAEEGIIYVEGEEEDGGVAGLTNGASRGGARDEEDEFPIANGVSDSEDDDLEDDDDDDDDMEVDDGASAAGESLDEDDVDHEDVEESADEEESDVETAPPPKVQKTSKAFSKRR